MVFLLKRPGIGEAIASALGLVVVLTTLVAVDVRVHDRFWALVSETSTSGLATWSARASAFSDAIVQAAHDRSIDQAPLLVFTVVAAALLIFMLRT